MKQFFLKNDKKQQINEERQKMKIIEIEDLDDFYYKIEDNILYWSEYGIEELNEVEDLTELKVWQYQELVKQIKKLYPDYNIDYLIGKFI